MLSPGKQLDLWIEGFVEHTYFREYPPEKSLDKSNFVYILYF